MTVTTNALLEGRTARTAFVATRGFRDIVALGRQSRPELYRLCAARPAPLAPDELRFEADERMGPDGPVTPLTADGAAAVARRIAAVRPAPEAVAVALLHGYRHPEHELAVGDALRDRLPGIHVSLSHRVVGTFREYERAATTELDAALTPLLRDYLRRLAGRAAEAGLPEPTIMQSSGGLTDLAGAAGNAAVTVLSGPAGGAAGAALLASSAGFRDALCLDMGGTSCDVCLVTDGRVREEAGGEIAGRPVAVPMVAVHTVGAGGGSVAWLDSGGALRVGPRSAGADPGPACYGRGGSEPTVTDAHLVLGHLPDRLADGLRLDADAAHRAIGALARRASLKPGACARGILRVVDAEMVRALRVVTVQRGVDPRELAMLAFGGAGPLHACAIADQLGMVSVVCPHDSGVLAALGLIAAPRRRDAQRTVLLRGEQITDAAIAAVVEELAATAARALGAPLGEPPRVTFEMRYAGQAFELAIAATPGTGAAALRERFAAEHADRYGHRDPDAAIELVTVRVSAVAETPAVALAGTPAGGELLRGPAVVPLPTATLLVAPGWEGSAGADGSIVLRRTR